MSDDTDETGSSSSGSPSYSVEQVLEGDHEDFAALVREESERLFRVVVRILKDKHEAEGIVQETFLQAYKNRDRFRGESAFTTWLIGIGINLEKSRRRKNRRSDVLSEGDIDDLQPEFRFGFYKESPNRWRPLEELEQSEQHRIAHDAIEQLPDSYQTVIMLRDIEELSTKETAEALDISPGNVRVRVHRARQALRALLEKHLQGETLRYYAVCGSGLC